MSLHGYSVTMGLGRVQSGEYDQIFLPRNPRPGKVGVVLCHGSGNPQEFINLAVQPASVRLAAALASAGIPCIAGDFGYQSWGNDTILSRIDAAWAVLAAAAPISTDKVALLGVSMGGAAIARYSQMYPAKTAAVVGILPLWDLVAFYEANPGAVADQIAAAWGVTAPAALPAGADFASTPELAASVPHLAGYSTTDATVLPAWITAYTTAVGGTAVVTNPDSGHTNASVGGLPVATIGAFLAANGS